MKYLKILMTNIKLIDIYLEGFRAYHYDKLTSKACPYDDETLKSKYWQKGYQYAQNLEEILTLFFQQNHAHGH
jgi:hypothetical protein